MLHKPILIWKCWTEFLIQKKYASHEEESDDKMQTKVAWADAANAIELFMKFAKEQPSYSGREVMQLHVIYNNFIRKRQKKKKWKQADIRTAIERVQSSKNGPSTSSTDPAPQHEESAEPSSPNESAEAVERQ
jgi:hypothetical protein